MTQKKKNTPLGSLKKKLSKQRLLAPHRSFALTNRHNKPRPTKKVPSSRQLIKESWHLFKSDKKLFIGLTSIYVILGWLIVGGVSQLNYSNYKDMLAELPDINPDSLFYTGTLFVAILGGAYNASATELNQFLVGLSAVLFFIITVWAVRNISSDQKVTIRQSLYNGPTPLISLLLVILVIGLQLIPGLIGVLILSLINSQDYIQGGVEAMAFAAAAILLIVLSIYFIVSSIVAAVIVTLPNMYPVASLRLAKKLVIGRRFTIFLRLLLLMITIALLWAIVLLPIIYIDSKLVAVSYLPLVSITIQLLGGVSLLLGTIYIYRLYRNLL